jgi:hypothetical protein
MFEFRGENYSHAAFEVDVIDEFDCAGTSCRPIESGKCPSMLASREVVASPPCRFYASTVRVIRQSLYASHRRCCVDAATLIGRHCDSCGMNGPRNVHCAHV